MQGAAYTRLSQEVELDRQGAARSHGRFGYESTTVTLIIPFISDDFAMLVSDRRFVLPNGRSVDEDGNKVVVFNRHHCFGYTGLATLNGYPTDMWLADVLASVGAKPLPEALKLLRERATEQFLRLDVKSRWKRHAFVGIGWSRLMPMNILRPAMFRVSNYHTSDGSRLPEAEDIFRVYLNVLGPRCPFMWGAIGQPISTSLTVAATRLFRRAGRSRISANIVWRVVSSVMSYTARQNVAVGRGLLAICLPLASVGPSQTFQMIAPLNGLARFDNTVASFLDVLARPDKFVLHGPTIVENGVVAHGLKIIRLDADSSGRDIVAERYLKKAGANTYFRDGIVPPLCEP